ncbi:MAG: TerB family tellurite resistance protein [Chloroflexi bacterium]|nr:TerB family tellurite resistance protein [Chloroflexota bacterium]
MNGFLDRLRGAAADPSTEDDAPSPAPIPAAGTLAGETETVRRIVARLDALPAARARFLAGFAYVLARAAHADLDISEAETAVMESAVAELGGLDPAQAVIVVELAKLQSRTRFGTEDYLVTREFAGLASDDEKLAVLRACFAVSAADDEISSEEAGAINEIARELGVERPALNAVREAYVDRFSAIRAARRLARG